MAQTQATSEKEQYLRVNEDEAQRTLRLLRAYPADKADLKPSDRMGSAKDVAWVLALSNYVVDPILKGELSGAGKLPPAPSSWQETLSAFEESHRAATDKIRNMKDEDMNGTVRMPVGPGKVGDLRRGEVLWMFLHDRIHHRGQLSVYCRLAGAKVPSIYGPSGDEPWT